MDRAQIAEQIVAHLASKAPELERAWNNPAGTPTRHLVIDELLPPALAQAVFDAYPATGEGFVQNHSTKERKKTSADLRNFAPILTEISFAFQDPRVVDVIRGMTGIDTLEPDPLFYAGGLSMMTRGDFLNPHIDNSHDSARKKYRRVNLLYYISPGWSEENGGNLELWDDEVNTPVTIVSRFNRLAIMETNDRSYHSVSPVVVDKARCCVSNYYFSDDSPNGNEYFHVTSFTGRPDQKALRAWGRVDNLARNTLSRALGTGRGRRLVNKAALENKDGGDR